MECKFLSLRQILLKLAPTYEHAETTDFAHLLWCYHKDSETFPTIIIVRQCMPSPSSSPCRHQVFLYLGQDLKKIVLDGPRICALLNHHEFDLPRHFIRND